MCANASEQILLREIAVYTDKKGGANGVRREQRPLMLVADEQRIVRIFEKVFISTSP